MSVPDTALATDPTHMPRVMRGDFLMEKFLNMAMYFDERYGLADTDMELQTKFKKFDVVACTLLAKAIASLKPSRLAQNDFMSAVREKLLTYKEIPPSDMEPVLNVINILEKEIALPVDKRRAFSQDVGFVKFVEYCLLFEEACAES